MAAGASIWIWGVCPLVRSACSCSSALARQVWIFGRSTPGSSETAAVRRFGGSVRRTLARSRWTRPHQPRRCASANVGITPILGIASSWSFQTGTARKGQRLSVRRGSGLGGWQSASTTVTALSLSTSTTLAVAVSARTRARNQSGSTSTPRFPCVCGIHRAPRAARIHRQRCPPS